MLDIHITCSWEKVRAMAEAFEEQFEAQQEEVVVLDWGTSYKKQEGYIVIEWDGEVNEAFIDQLTTDSDIVDFSIFTVPCTTDDQLYALERAES